MEITGIQTIAAPRQLVWDALNDPEVLKRSLSGCVSVDRISPEEFKVVMAAAIGPMRARFNGALKMADVNAPESCTMFFEGQGGVVGFGKGNSTVKLTELNGLTELTYSAEAQVGGKLAQVGSRLIDSVARKMADDFFKAFKAQLAGGLEEGQATAAAAPGATAVDKPAAQKGDAPVAVADASALSLPVPVAASAPPVVASAPATVMVPGWWLAIAAAIGSIATLAGVLFAR
jgi:hypothetical protein